MWGNWYSTLGEDAVPHLIQLHPKSFGKEFSFTKKVKKLVTSSTDRNSRRSRFLQPNSR